MPTLIYCTGFEYGLETPSVKGGGLIYDKYGTVTVQSTTKRTGGYALRCYAASEAATSPEWRLASGESYYFVGRVYIRVGTAPSATTALIRQSHAQTYFHIGYNQATSQFYAQVGINTAQAGPTVELDTWYRIDYRFSADATTYTIDWQVDGIDQTQATKGSLTAAVFLATTYFRLGLFAAVTGDIYFDDFVLSETSGDYPIGAGGVIGLRPNADGTHNNAANIMEDSAGNDIDGSTYFAYDKLDEDPWITTANADYVRQTDIGTANYCEINFADTTETVIHGVRGILQYASATSTANNGACQVRDSNDQVTTILGTPDVPVDMSYTEAFYASAQIATPSGGWTMAHVNALRARFGYSGDATPDPYWLAMILEVAYGIAATPTWIPKVIMVM